VVVVSCPSGCWAATKCGITSSARSSTSRMAWLAPSPRSVKWNCQYHFDRTFWRTASQTKQKTLTHGHRVQRIPRQSHMPCGAQALGRRPIVELERLGFGVGRDAQGERPERLSPCFGEPLDQCDPALGRLGEGDGRGLAEEARADRPREDHLAGVFAAIAFWTVIRGVEDLRWSCMLVLLRDSRRVE
jgi:hypothetical protein